MKPYSYKISLRVRHPSLHPAKISSELKLEPSHMWNAGEARATPKNTPLKGTWPDTYWTTDIFVGECPDVPLAVALEKLIGQLRIHRAFFQEIRLDGGKAEFFVGWFIDGNRGEEFDAGLLGRLSDLGVNLSLDIYPPSDPSDQF